MKDDLQHLWEVRAGSAFNVFSAYTNQKMIDGHIFSSTLSKAMASVHGFEHEVQVVSIGCGQGDLVLPIIRGLSHAKVKSRLTGIDIEPLFVVSTKQRFVEAGLAMPVDLACGNAFVKETYRTLPKGHIILASHIGYYAASHEIETSYALAEQLIAQLAEDGFFVATHESKNCDLRQLREKYHPGFSVNVADQILQALEHRSENINYISGQSFASFSFPPGYARRFEELKRMDRVELNRQYENAADEPVLLAIEFTLQAPLTGLKSAQREMFLNDLESKLSHQQGALITHSDFQVGLAADHSPQAKAALLRMAEDLVNAIDSQRFRLPPGAKVSRNVSLYMDQDRVDLASIRGL